MKFETSVTLRNSDEASLTLHLEPWGEQHSVLPGASVRLVATAEQSGEFEVEHTARNIFVWAWPTATLRVFAGAEEITSAATVIPAPAGPLKEFLSTFER
jgi:hypothetical protein